MLDANNGYNLNLAKRVLAETADCEIFWLEEPLHEDDILYRDLRDWLAQQRLATLIADGEGQADPRLVQWARAGLVDVIQYDIFGYGFTRWLARSGILHLSSGTRHRSRGSTPPATRSRMGGRWCRTRRGLGSRWTRRRSSG